ncbi:hypothetical protein O7622_15605 [Micromonospora sp. WMMD1076]|uniref:hypothetical protein n=1 Tax=Micromonospora sp. WMMD1076 TaxID=3016103 RepID=UPI00249C0098|nr:hypothetical protein [Micromonospora sp. WMMD1076]WFF04513.1 hypothetical protein O7622_15605 [Micromonospora sp. WMMD1076]
MDLPAKTAGRIQSDQAFEAAALSRDGAFEVTTAYLISQLVEHNLGVAMLPSAYTPQLAGVTTIEIRDASPRRIRHLEPVRPHARGKRFLVLLDNPARDPRRSGSPG